MNAWPWPNEHFNLIADDSISRSVWMPAIEVEIGCMRLGDLHKSLHIDFMKNWIILIISTNYRKLYRT